MLMKQGIKESECDGINAVIVELKQLYDCDVIEPHLASLLTIEERTGALAYLMLLSRNAYGSIKGQGCADGRKQRVYTSKEDLSSATVATDSVFLTFVIDAHKQMDIGIVDLPGAFMQAEMDDIVFKRLVGTMVELSSRSIKQSISCSFTLHAVESPFVV
jgi:hypothetical protein